MPNYYSDGTHSDAAIDYYNQHKDATWCCPTIRAFDAGHAAALDTVTPAPQPERLTDPDDPRIRDGARERWVFADGSAVEGAILVKDFGACIRYADARRSFSVDTYAPAERFLLAEAPDPDADVIPAITEAMTTEGWLDDNSRDVLDNLRAAGYDVVKRAES